MGKESLGNLYDDSGGSDDGGFEEALEDHINDPEPHPAYDDIPTLTIIFENGLA